MRTYLRSKVAEQQRRSKERDTETYKCACCNYTSDRYFNIVRHERRIHLALAKPISCCGRFFSTKGEYYLHCEKEHPKKRKSAITSRKKYKILKNMLRISAITEQTVESDSDDERPIRQLRERQIKCKTSLEMSAYAHLDFEDIPLSYALKYRKLVEKKRRRSSMERTNVELSDTAKKEVTVTQVNLENYVMVSSSFSTQSEKSKVAEKISANSPLNARLCNENLPLKKRRVRPLGNVSNVPLQPLPSVKRRNVLKEKEISKVSYMDVNKENEYPCRSDRETSIRVTFQETANPSTITDHFRDFILSVDFEQFKIF